MRTVFNTGKVAIGAAYQPSQRYAPDRDMERLQRALVDQPHPVDADGILIAIAVAALGAAALLKFWI